VTSENKSSGASFYLSRTAKIASYWGNYRWRVSAELYVLSKAWKCAVPPNRLHSKSPLLRTCNIPATNRETAIKLEKVYKR